MKVLFMVKKILILCIGLIILISIILYSTLLQPVKIAIKKEALKSKIRYILVRAQKSTISEWVAIGDETGMFEQEKNVVISGYRPSGYNYKLESGNNTFVCYGEFIGTEDVGTEKVQKFYAIDWDILYPVKRTSPFEFIMPKSYLCKSDMVK